MQCFIFRNSTGDLCHLTATDAIEVYLWRVLSGIVSVFLSSTSMYSAQGLMIIPFIRNPVN